MLTNDIVSFEQPGPGHLRTALVFAPGQPYVWAGFECMKCGSANGLTINNSPYKNSISYARCQSDGWAGLEFVKD